MGKSIQTESMRELAGDDVYITAGQHKDTKLWHGYMMANHPTPSGCERWMMLYSDQRAWPDQKTAVEEFVKYGKFDGIKTLYETKDRQSNNLRPKTRGKSRRRDAST